MPRTSIGRITLAASAAFASAGAFAFDWNKTHLYNPNWPPHAKFHDAQTISLSVGLAAATMLAVLTPGGWSVKRLSVAAGAASLYWATQLFALSFPGTALADPPAKTRAQAVVASVALAVNAMSVAGEIGALRRRR